MTEVFKRVSMFVIILLFLISLGRDLTVGTFPIEKTTSTLANAESAKQAPTVKRTSQPMYSPSENVTKRYQRVQHKVTAGETVLSIMENLNKGGPPVTIQQMLSDFEVLNPNVNPHQIKTNQTYTFPKYQLNENRL